MSGIGRWTSGLGLSVLATVVLIASPEAEAGKIKLAKGQKATLRTDARLPASIRPAPSPIEVGLEGLVTPPTFTFEGLNFLSNAPVSTYYWTRPTPYGAVGPNHIVSLTPGALTFHSKAGVLQNSPGQRLAVGSAGAAGSFFASLSPVTEGTGGRVIYDQYSDRFVVLLNDWTATGAGDPSNSSAILIAVSDDGDPSGTWYFYKLNTSLSFAGVDSFSYRYGASVGPDGILITVDFVDYGFTDYQASRLFIIQKAPLYSGGAAVVNSYDPGIEAGFEEEIYGLIPVQQYGPAPEGLLTFLVTMSYFAGSAEPAEELYGLIEIDGTAAAPVFSQEAGGFYLLGDFADAAASYLVPQLGTTKTINADGPDPVTVWRGDDLWTVVTSVLRNGPDAGQPTVHWINLDLVLGEITQGDIGGEDISVGARTYFPSINVNDGGSVAISFTASGPNLYPGTYYTGRLPTDAAGEFATPKALAAGLSYFYRVFGGSDTGNGIGPTTVTLVDPTNDNTFWTYGSYAGTRGTVFTQLPNEDGRWGTRWGSFSITPSPGDFNADGSVDATDLDKFQTCMTGPSTPYTPAALPPGCDLSADLQGIISADFDRDGDVDLADWGVIQRCFSGTGVPSDPNCVN